MIDKKTFYITTPIYYPSAKLHIGHAYTTIAGDVLKRYKKLQGYEVFYLTGTDEHGEKIEEAANKMKLEPKLYVDNVVEDIKKTWSLLDIEYDRFIRTTDEDHKEIVQQIFSKLLEKGDIYLSEYSGLYCKSDEAYYTETQAKNGNCPDCGKKLELISEESYFFKCSKYVDKLVKFYEDNPNWLEPNYRIKELLNNFIKPGLDDLAVSRTSFKWGIPVKENDEHVIYVWIDALSNYISALGYNTSDQEKFEKFWPADVQLLGKEIIRFHAIYWPMILMALDLPLPKKLFAHGWLLMENDKMSKSKGNVIYPEFLVENYGQDTLRYYLMREVPFGSDGQFTPESFINRINNDLVNDLSNLVNRTVSMANQYFNGKVVKRNFTNSNYTEYNDSKETYISEYHKMMDKLEFSKALEYLWKLISSTNKLIDLEEPWILVKDIKTNINQLDKCLWTLLDSINKIAELIAPFMPTWSLKVLKNIGKEKIGNYDTEYQVIKIPEIIYQRLDKEAEKKKINEKMKSDLIKSKEKLTENFEEEKKVPRGTIEFSEFQKSEIQVGEIIKCDTHPKADKLYIMQVKLENETRQIISSLVEFYDSKELINKKVLVVTNLKPIKLRGEESNGMILTTKKKSQVNIIEVEAEIGALVE